jgi:hypothetical protein
VRFTIRRAKIAPLLRDKFEVFGEQVISFSLGLAAQFDTKAAAKSGAIQETA